MKIPINLYRCISWVFNIKISITNPKIIWDITIIVNVFDNPKWATALTVKNIIHPPNIPPNKNFGVILSSVKNALISPVINIVIKKNIDPTTKLKNVAIIGVVCSPNSPFTKASNVVDIPASTANNIAIIFSKLSTPLHNKILWNNLSLDYKFI